MKTPNGDAEVILIFKCEDCGKDQTLFKTRATYRIDISFFCPDCRANKREDRRKRRVTPHVRSGAAKITAWTPDREDQFMALWLSGASTEAIADKMGISRNAVTCKRWGLRLPTHQQVKERLDAETAEAYING